MKNIPGLIAVERQHLRSPPAPQLMGARVTNQAGDVIIVPVKGSDPLK
ncbi:MAG TPA: hypothetical protein VJU02_06875 [Nitrospiraceae bacterium]|nr:hypothetical protein [Nitrospiraceae bacterium]